MFDRSTRVLDYQPSSVPERWGKRRYLLWPAFCQQVLVQHRARDELDLFAATVLQLRLAGVSAPEELARLLQLHPSLIRRILSRLEQRGLLDAAAASPERNTSPRVEQLTFYMFRDAWTGALFPRCMASLPLITVAPRSRDWVIPPNSIGRNERRNATPVLIDRPPPQKELAEADIVAAVREQRRDLRQFQTYGSRMDREAESFAPVGDPRAIEMIGDPTPVLLLTAAFVPQAETAGASWLACDPFGLGVSDAMRTRIGERVAEIAELRETMAKLRPDASDGAPHPPGPGTLADHVRSAREAARVMVERELTIGIGDHGHLYTALVKMQQALVEARMLDGKLANEDAQGRFDQVLSQAQVALEHALDMIRVEFPTDGAWCNCGLVETLPDQNAELIQQLAYALGFEPAPPKRLPSRLTRVKLRKIVSAADYDPDSLNARLIAAMLAARREGDDASGTPPRHPLWRAAKRQPDLLLMISDVARLRNAAAHASGETFTLADAERQVQNVYAALRALGFPRVRRPGAERGRSDDRPAELMEVS